MFLFKKNIKDILLDAPKLLGYGVLNKDEEVLLYAPFLYHKFAFSRVKKYYLIWHYGSLLTSLEQVSKKAAILSFLEVGCGTGSTSIYMAKKVYVKKVTGLDLDPIRIQIAKK